MYRVKVQIAETLRWWLCVLLLPEDWVTLLVVVALLLQFHRLEDTKSSVLPVVESTVDHGTVAPQELPAGEKGME